MNFAKKYCFALMTAVFLAGCGGGSDDPSDKYAGSWQSSCFPYEAVNGNTYFQTTIISLTKVSAYALNGSFSNTIAHSDSSCKNVLGAISNPSNSTIQIGDKANVLGGEVDKITYSTASESRPGYMTVNATEFFLIFTDTPDQIPSGWGLGSPHTKIELKHTVGSQLKKNVAANDHLAPASFLDTYSN